MTTSTPYSLRQRCVLHQIVLTRMLLLLLAVGVVVSVLVVVEFLALSFLANESKRRL